MKKRLLKKVIKRLSRETPARFRYNAKVKATWIAIMNLRAPPPIRFSNYHFDLDHRGNPIPCGLWQWSYMFEYQTERRILKRTDLDGFRVSTVFLGMDDGFSPGGPPVTFESMVFGGPLDDEQERYITRAEALAGHALLVERCLAASAEANP